VYKSSNFFGGIDFSGLRRDEETGNPIKEQTRKLTKGITEPICGIRYDGLTNKMGRSKICI